MEIKFKDAICTVYNAHRIPGDILYYIQAWVYGWLYGSDIGILTNSQEQERHGLKIEKCVVAFCLIWIVTKQLIRHNTIPDLSRTHRLVPDWSHLLCILSYPTSTNWISIVVCFKLRLKIPWIIQLCNKSRNCKWDFSCNIL